MLSRWMGLGPLLVVLISAMCPGARSEAIHGTLAMPDRSVVPTTKVILNGGQRSSMSARDGSFAFEDVPPGVYLLEVLSTTFHYSAIKVKVDDATGIVAIEYKYPGAARKEAVHPLLLTAHTKWNHFEKRETMKIGGMFKSPMTIIMIGSMVMMMFLPKMLANLDPEQLEEIKGQQKAVADSASQMSISDLISTAFTGAAAPPAAQPPPSSQGQRGLAGGAGGGGAGSSRGRGKKKHG